MTRRSARSPRFDVTIVLTYYLPYTSGLTEVARTVAEGLAARGRRVAVVACRHDPDRLDAPNAAYRRAQHSTRRDCAWWCS